MALYDSLILKGLYFIVLWANNWARITKPATSNAGESQYKLNRSINILTVVLFVTFNMCVTRSL
jgi:hypothetical protein